MFDFLAFFIQVLESIIYIYIAYQLLDRKLTIKNSIIIGIVLGSFWNLVHFTNTEGIYGLLIYRTLMILLIFFFSRANILKVIICVFVSSNISLMIEYTIMAVITMSLDTSIQTFFNNRLIYFIVYLISFVVGCGSYIIMKKFNLTLFDSQENFFSIDRTFSQDNNILARFKEIQNDYNLVIIIFIAQMTLITYYFYLREFFMISSSGSLDNLEFQTVCISIIIFLLNIMTLFMAKKVEKVKKENYRNKIREMEFSQIEKENLIIKQYKHDLFNHFSLLCSLAEDKKHDEVYSYLVNYHEDMKRKIIAVKTGLEELDILLFSKINKAYQNNIKIDYKCIANIHCNRSHIIDFISIIANLLDNAIEASQKSEMKLLEIHIDEEIVNYTFTIKNSVEDKKILKPDMLLKEGFSTKGSGRGFGLKIVNRLVKKYNGIIEFNNDDDLFEIEVILPKHELERY